MLILFSCDHCDYSQNYRLHCSSYFVESVLNTISSLSSSVLRTFKMSSHYTPVSLNSLVCYHSLTVKLDLENLTMCSCKECSSCDLTCHVSKDFSKCNECTYFSF